MKGLTQRQANVSNFIEDFIEKKHYPPTIREIGDHFSITAKGAFDHIRALEKKGFIRIQRNKSRAIEILKSPEPDLTVPRKITGHCIRTCSSKVYTCSFTRSNCCGNPYISRRKY